MSQAPADIRADGSAPGPNGSPPPPDSPRLHALVHRLGMVEQLDAVAKPLGRGLRSLLGPGGVRDVLSGRPLGHALHPILTDVPIGTWTSATLLDAIGGDASDEAAERLIAVGIAAALPTAVTGWTDWSDTEAADDEVRRVGLVHAAANVTALALYTASLAARRAGHRGRGRALALAGAGALTVGGHLGGHLSYARGVGVDATAFGSAIEEWTDVAAAADLVDGRPICREARGQQLLLVRDAGRLHALADRCSHRGGALHEGELSDGCITCPLHGSRFRLADGSVERGPSPYPQPTYEVRERDGRVEVRSAHERPTM